MTITIKDMKLGKGTENNKDSLVFSLILSGKDAINEENKLKNFQLPRGINKNAVQIGLVNESFENINIVVDNNYDKREEKPLSSNNSVNKKEYLLKKKEEKVCSIKIDFTHINTDKEFQQILTTFGQMFAAPGEGKIHKNSRKQQQGCSMKPIKVTDYLISNASIFAMDLQLPPVLLAVINAVFADYKMPKVPVWYDLKAAMWAFAVNGLLDLTYNFSKQMVTSISQSCSDGGNKCGNLCLGTIDGLMKSVFNIFHLLGALGSIGSVIGANVTGPYASVFFVGAFIANACGSIQLVMQEYENLKKSWVTKEKLSWEDWRSIKNLLVQAANVLTAIVGCCAPAGFILGGPLGFWLSCTGLSAATDHLFISFLDRIVLDPSLLLFSEVSKCCAPKEKGSEQEMELKEKKFSLFKNNLGGLFHSINNSMDEEKIEENKEEKEELIKKNYENNDKNIEKQENYSFINGGKKSFFDVRFELPQSLSELNI